MNFLKRQSCLRQRKKRYTRACRPSPPPVHPDCRRPRANPLPAGASPPGRSLPAKTAQAADTPQQQPPAPGRRRTHHHPVPGLGPLWGYKPDQHRLGVGATATMSAVAAAGRGPSTGNLCRAIGVQGPTVTICSTAYSPCFRLRRLRGVRREHHGHIVFIAIRPNPVCTVDGEGQGQRISPGFCPGKVYRGGHILCRQSLQLRGWPRKVTSSIWVKISARMPSGT